MKFTIQNGAIEINGEAILEKVNLDINDGDHIAIVGPNGAGKTTLLKAIINNDMLSEGIEDEPFRIIKTGIFKIGYLEQIKVNDNYTLFEELCSAFEELISLEKKLAILADNLDNDKNILKYTSLLDRYEALGGYSYKKDVEVMIREFGFYSQDKEKKLSEFSGGERIKICFMKLLLTEADLLVLDEPTNHLDITTIEWLENYLKNYKKAFIVVSHDRMFLDNIVDIIYDIEYGEVIKYKGNYSKFTLLKEQRYNKLLKDYEYQQSEIKRLNALYERFRSKPTKAKMALSKLRQIEKMVKIEKPRKIDTKSFKANTSNILKPGKIVLSAKELEYGFNVALGKVNLEVQRGKKIGIIGSNGTGKSTLLKTLCSIIKPYSGSVKYGYNVKYDYFDQNLKFETNGTVLEEFMHKYPELLTEDARRALGAFLFSGEDVLKRLDVLSGGEKVRLLLCEIFYSKSNLIFLDEPTNHLDIISKEKLAKTLKEYPETIIFVSHDRYFVRELADELLVLKENKIKYYKYGYDEYLEESKKISEEEIKIKSEKLSTNIIKESKNSLAKVEREIDSISKKIKLLTEELYKEENYLDYAKLNDINNQINLLNEELMKKEKEWDNLVN